MHTQTLTFPLVQRWSPRLQWLSRLLFLFTLLVPAQAVWSVTDRLQLPAAASPLASQVLLLDIARAGERLVAVGERGHVVFSDDQGRSWQQAQVPVAVTLTGVSFADAQHGWAVGHDGVILTSDDGGAHWVLQLDGRAFNASLIRYYQEQLARAEGGESSLNVDDLAMALDDAHFAAEEGPSRPWLDVYFSDAQHGWAVGAYGLFVATRDGGQSWQPVPEQLDNTDRFHLNTLVGSGERLLIAGEAGVLFESTDGGASWERLDAGYDGPLFGALLTPQQILLTGLRGRLFAADAASDWLSIEAPTRATLNGALLLTNGGVLAFGNGGVLLYRAAGEVQFRLYPQPDRHSYLGAQEVSPGELLLVGQGGVSRLSLQQMMEVGR